MAVKDGVGFIDLYGQDNHLPVNEIRLKTEYIFEGEARIDRELEEVLKRLEPVPFKNAYFSLKLEISKPVNPSPKTPKTGNLHSAVQATNNLAALNLQQVDHPEPFETKVKLVMASLASKNYQPVKDFFTAEGWDVFNQLLAYGNARLLADTAIKTIQFGKTVICRGPKMSFSFASNNRKFVEDVVFYFDENEKIASIVFGLDERALNSVLEKSVWNQAERLTIIMFLESYKTAYALKRLDYIRSIFADDALIIVGNKIKVKPMADNPFQNNQIIKYNRYTKEQYIKNLQHCFAGNEFINIRFEDSEIRKAGQSGGRYGIQIKQNYFSSSYGDAGYLFLLIDLDNPDEPLIHVRTWQPEKNPDGSIYGLEDF